MSIDTWLDNTFQDNSVTGVLLVDDSSGLSLGSRGVADNDDAPQLKWFLDNQASSKSPDLLTLRHNDHIIYIARTDSLITAIYKPLNSKSSTNDASA